MKTIKFFLLASLLSFAFSCDSNTSSSAAKLQDKISTLEKEVDDLKLEIAKNQLKTVTTFKLISSNPFIEKSHVEDFFNTVDDIWDDVVDVGYDNCIKRCGREKVSGKIKDLSNCIVECTKSFSPFNGKYSGLAPIDK